MGTIADKLTYLNGTKTAIKEAIEAKGVTVTDTDTFRSYATKIGEISGGGAPATKFGASIDTWIGDVDENGTLNKTTWTGGLNFSGVKTLGVEALKNTFYGLENVNNVDFSSLESVGMNSMESTFRNCLHLTSADLSSLQTVGFEGMKTAFYGCLALTSVDLSSLQSVGSYGMYQALGYTKLRSVDLSSLQTVGTYGLGTAFGHNSNLTSIDLSSLQSVGSNGMSSAFTSCEGLTAISFPSLTDVQTDSFGSSTSTCAFRSCTALTEIHFRADMQATIEAMSQYANKWGAKSSTIYFNLIGTITINGVAYSRNEANSIYVDGTKTFVAWKDAGENIVYTDATTEPAVGTVVYSDPGTTQIGTVSEVA